MDSCFHRNDPFRVNDTLNKGAGRAGGEEIVLNFECLVLS